VAAIAGNVVFLCFFKYFGSGAMPIAISFYTFSQIMYVAELGHGESFELLDYLSYITFFPKILQGPIADHKSIKEGLEKLSQTRVNVNDLTAGIMLFTLGLFKKVILAEVLGKAVDFGYQGLQGLTGMDAIILAVSYSFQLYFDFSGYCDMAEGVCRMLGMELTRNFDAPYKAGNIAEFWDRWHISLTKFFTKYIYIPLGGSRKGTVRKYVNALIVFATSGLWHGAGLNYLLWGTLNGLLQIGGNILNPFKDKFYALLKIGKESEGLKWFKRLGTFILMSCTWVFFRAPSTSYALSIFKRAAMKPEINRLFDGTLYTLGLSQKSFNMMLLFLLFVLLFDYACVRGSKPLEAILKSHFLFKCFVFVLLAAIVVVFGIYGTAFDANSFIYIQY
jgi:alginate O-acetyltransferase complex protein AlgI